MTLVPLEPSKDGAELEGVELRAVAEIVEETLDECRFLLAEADRTAAAVRSQATEDASKTRQEASTYAAQQIASARAVANHVTHDADAHARQIVGDAEVRRAEIEQRIATIRRATRAAAAYVEATMRDADRWAVRRKSGSESEAIALLEASWRASTALQRELLEEADAEAVEILRRADAEAERLRCDAMRLHGEARRIREGARRYAEDLLAANLTVAFADAAPEHVDARRPRLVRSAARRLVPAVLLLVLALGLRAFVAAPYTVAATSMEPGLHDGERVVVNKLAYRFGDPERGEVVLFRVDESLPGSFSVGDTLVKRVIGLPGDVVEAVGGLVLVNRRPLDEPWAEEPTSAFGPHLVPQGSLFVLGDNRTTSVDSRVFGVVDMDDVVGRADGVIWPIGGLRQI